MSVCTNRYFLTSFGYCFRQIKRSATLAGLHTLPIQTSRFGLRFDFGLQVWSSKIIYYATPWWSVPTQWASRRRKSLHQWWTTRFLAPTHARRLIQYKWLVMRTLNYSLLRTPNNFASSPQAKPLLWCRARQRRGAVHEWIRPEARAACCAWYHGQSLPVPRPWINAESRLSTSTYQDAFPSYSCTTIYFSLFTFVSYRPAQKTSYFLVLTPVILS